MKSFLIYFISRKEQDYCLDLGIPLKNRVKKQLNDSKKTLLERKQIKRENPRGDLTQERLIIMIIKRLMNCAWP
jgi:hypothetical protein